MSPDGTKEGQLEVTPSLKVDPNVMAKLEQLEKLLEQNNQDLEHAGNENMDAVE